MLSLIYYSFNNMFSYISKEARPPCNDAAGAMLLQNYIYFYIISLRNYLDRATFYNNVMRARVHVRFYRTTKP